MARSLRITVPHLPFHIIDRGNNRQVVFPEEEDFIYFLKLLKKYKKELQFKLYHFCLMPNHIHLITEPTIADSLPKIMMRLTLAYSSYFNRKYRKVGHVWEGRYKSSLIDKEDYFIWCGLYVELNPVRAGLVERPEDWRWSSFRFYGFGERDPLIKDLVDMNPYYLQLGNESIEREEGYRKNIEGVMEEDFLQKIRKQLKEGVFGRSDFIQKAKEKFKIKSLKCRGRPKKEKK